MKRTAKKTATACLFLFFLAALAAGPAGAVEVYSNGATGSHMDFYIINNTQYSVNVTQNSDFDHNVTTNLGAMGTFGNVNINPSCNDSEGGHAHVAIYAPNFCQALISVDHKYDAGCDWVAWDLRNDDGGGLTESGTAASGAMAMTGGIRVEQLYNDDVVISLVMAADDDQSTTDTKMGNSKVVLVINYNAGTYSHPVSGGAPWTP